MRYRDFASTLRHALGPDIRALRRNDWSPGDRKYTNVYRTRGASGYYPVVIVDGSPKRLGTYEDPEAAALVRMALHHDARLVRKEYRDRWLEDMKHTVTANRWVHDNMRAQAVRASASALRRSPAFAQWRSHVKYKPGNSGFHQAHASWMHHS